MVRTRNKSGSGFTLVELLVVIGIIALLISLLVPALARVRQSSISIKCLARIRRLCNATVMYSNENKGSLPPIALTCNGSGGSYGSPSIFPLWAPGSGDPKDYGYLAKYLGARAALDLYICPGEQIPALDSGASTVTYDRASYKYHQQLGGDDGSTSGYCRPWKVAQVKQSSNQALFVDGKSQDPQPASRSRLAFANYGFNVQAINEQATSKLHFENVLAGTYKRFGIFDEPRRVGMLNIGFVDGSARSVATEFSQHPPKPYESVLIDPYHLSSTW